MVGKLWREERAVCGQERARGRKACGAQSDLSLFPRLRTFIPNGLGSCIRSVLLCCSFTEGGLGLALVNSVPLSPSSLQVPLGAFCFLSPGLGGGDILMAFREFKNLVIVSGDRGLLIPDFLKNTHSV